MSSSEERTYRFILQFKGYEYDQEFFDERLNKLKETAARLLDEIRSWDQENIRTEAKQYDISIKFSGRVFAYLAPRRKHFVVYTYDTDGEWKGFPIRSDEDLGNIRKLLRKNYEEEKQKT